MSLKETIFSKLNAEQIQKIEQNIDSVLLALGLIERLRGPQGCPWDREQDHRTLRPYLIEEAYEVLDVLERYHVTKDPKVIAKETSLDAYVDPDGYWDEADKKELCEELGDVLLQILLHAQIAKERGDFDFGAVCLQMTKKLVHRHPHVFGESKVNEAADVLKNWEKLKKSEGKKRLLAGLPKSMPSLQKALRIGEKTKRVGFDWNSWEEVWKKVEEEKEELMAAIEKQNKEEIEAELGDLFFSLAQLARHFDLNPEEAHQKANDKFMKRFTFIEEECERQGVDLSNAGAERLEQMWNQAKTEAV